MPFLVAIAPAIAAAATVASVGIAIAQAARSTPKPHPGASFDREAGIEGARAELMRERNRSGGRRSTILTGASALIESDSDSLTLPGDRLGG